MIEKTWEHFGFAKRAGWWLTAAAVAVAMLASQPAIAETITGTAAALDGDDLVLTTAAGARRVRLCGIDAADRHQRARQARAALQGIVEGHQVRCVTVGDGTPCDGRSKATSGKRAIAQCFVGEQDVAAEMVRAGQACDWRKYSGGHYTRAVPGGQGSFLNDADRPASAHGLGRLREPGGQSGNPLTADCALPRHLCLLLCFFSHQTSDDASGPRL